MMASPTSFPTDPTTTNEAARILPPQVETLFLGRAERFSKLAVGHKLGDWLDFLARLTRAQHETATQLLMLPLPDASALALARRHGKPPLDACGSLRPTVWRRALRELCATLGDENGSFPEATRKALETLRAAPDESLERLADALVAGSLETADKAQLPFVAAVLQAVWTSWAARLLPGDVSILENPVLCPCCGSLPVASVVRTSFSINNLRYLHCSLCSTEWNVVRATCPLCASRDQAPSLRQLAGSQGTVQAETCDACQSYLKILYQEKDPAVDPVADDLATLTLDVLVDEAGYSRGGPNLFLIV